MSPKETEVFLAELAKKEAGTDVTREEASQLFDLERNANEKLESWGGLILSTNGRSFKSSKVQ